MTRSPVATAAELLQADPAALGDDALIAGSLELAEVRRAVAAKQAAFAAEIAHRSRPELGFSGLAQRKGMRNAENLVQQTSDTSKREAIALVRVGTLLTVDADPWLSEVGSAVASGHVSIEKADAISTGLGSPDAEVAADDLADAAAHLVSIAPSLPVEKVAARARELRDSLDVAGVRDRHAKLRAKRYLSLIPTGDGMTRLSGLLDPESAAIVGAAYDAATSPRRGGPRFVDTEAQAAADAIVADPRTTGQIALDTFVDLVRIGSEVDPDRVLGAKRHSVRVLVTARDLARGTGVAFIRDQTEAVPIETAARTMCDTGILPIEFRDDAEQALRLGVEKRFFSSRQREALAARDGGCRFAGCDRPVSWCESHHIIPVSKGGRTDIDDGILLCRHHHMLTHDNGWRIERDPTHGYVAIPPRTEDPRQQPVPLPSRSRALARLRT
jgi:hypothetical protein